MTRFRLLPLVLVLLGESTAVALLHRLGGTGGLDLGTLASVAAPAEDVVMAAARLVALAAAWWLLVSTALCVLARLAGLPAALRAVEWAALPPVRRLVERSLVATLSLSVVAGVLPTADPLRATAFAAPVAAAAEPGPLVPRVERGVLIPPGAPALWREPSPGSVQAGAPPSFATRSGATASAADASVPPGGEEADPRRTSLPRVHVVRQGEHLWGVAAQVVAEATGRQAGEVPTGEIAAYWARVIEANPASLASGDIDLVYPGEHVHLPPVGE